MNRLQLIEKLKEEKHRRLVKELNRRKAYNSLESFILYTKPDYILGWFHTVICGELDKFINKVIELKNEQLRRSRLSQEELKNLPPLPSGPRLVIMAPPRHGKSEIISRRAPAAAFGRCPDLEMIVASYGVELAGAMSKDLQAIMTSEEYGEIYPHVGLPNSPHVAQDRKKQAIQRATRFDVLKYTHTDHRGINRFKKAGNYKAAGVGSGITGLGADLLIIDDPYKDRADADSIVRRARVESWFKSAALTRLSPCGGIIVMCTRWRVDDLIGMLVEAGRINPRAEQYQVLRFPAIAQEDEPYRKKGEALHEQRFPLKALMEKREALGSRDFESLYQQDPLPSSDNIFKFNWIKYYDASTLPPLSKFSKLVMSWDMSFKNTSNSDFVVGQVWGRYKANFYLLDQVRGQMDFPQTKEAFLKLIEKWPMVYDKVVEDKANGVAIIQSLKDDITGIIAVNPKESKLARASAITTFFEAGNVYLPNPNLNPWVERELLPELLHFPKYKHDDQVDALSQALNYLKTHVRIIHPDNVAFLQGLR